MTFESIWKLNQYCEPGSYLFCLFKNIPLWINLILMMDLSLLPQHSTEKSSRRILNIEKSSTGSNPVMDQVPPERGTWGGSLFFVKLRWKVLRIFEYC